MKQSSSSQKSKESNYQKYLDELRKENFDESFPATETWLRSADTNLTNLKNKKSERKFINMKNYFSANKFKLAYTFLILAFVVAACNYPVTQQESAGDVLKWTVSKDNTEAVKKIENLDWLKSGEYNVNEDGNHLMYSLVIPKESHASISVYEEQLQAIGVDQINLIPLNETVKRPVYSAVLNDLFKIDINASNMSDAELSKEIDTQLKNAGIENAQVDFRNENGRRMVKIILPEGEMKEGGFDMTIKDGDKVNRIKNMRKTGADGEANRFKNKTDEEIRKMVKEDMGNPNLTDDMIEITRNDDKVMVKVKMTDTKGNKHFETEDVLK